MSLLDSRSSTNGDDLARLEAGLDALETETRPQQSRLRKAWSATWPHRSAKAFHTPGGTRSEPPSTSPSSSACSTTTSVCRLPEIVITTSTPPTHRCPSRTSAVIAAYEAILAKQRLDNLNRR